MGNILTKQFYRQRKDFEDSCAGRDAGLTFPEGVRCSTDIAYADDGIKAHVLDIYRPEDSEIPPESHKYTEEPISPEADCLPLRQIQGSA